MILKIARNELFTFSICTYDSSWNGHFYDDNHLLGGIFGSAVTTIAPKLLALGGEFLFIRGQEQKNHTLLI